MNQMLEIAWPIAAAVVAAVVVGGGAALLLPWRQTSSPHSKLTGRKADAWIRRECLINCIIANAALGHTAASRHADQILGGRDQP